MGIREREKALSSYWLMDGPGPFQNREPLFGICAKFSGNTASGPRKWILLLQNQCIKMSRRNQVRSSFPPAWRGSIFPTESLLVAVV